MKILLTGGLGFIGKRFIKKFSYDYDIIVFDRKEAVANGKDSSQFKNIIFEKGSIEDKKVFDVVTKHKPDIIIHLAALTGLTRCDDSPQKAFRVNVSGTQNVLDACAKTGSKFIFISSREVYGETKGNKSNRGKTTTTNRKSFTK